MTGADNNFWPTNEPGRANRQTGRVHFAALICESGHVLDNRVQSPQTYDDFCGRCGADVLTRCPNCGRRLRGAQDFEIPVVGQRYNLPPFCDGCAAALPWATPDQRMQALRRILKQQDISDDDRRLVSEDLQRLQAERGLMSDEQQSAAWQRVKERAPGLFGDVGKPIVTSLVTAWVKNKLGL